MTEPRPGIEPEIPAATDAPTNSAIDEEEFAANTAIATEFITSWGGTVPTKTALDVYYEQISSAAIAAMEQYQQSAQRLAKVPRSGHSRDGRVVVEMNAAGELLDFQLRGGALSWYDTATLGEVVTRTMRQTQERARELYQEQVEKLVPDEIVEAQQVVQDLLDRAALNDGTA
ncbi:MAG: YbaB/EbfC family nucleoid-associated protein [Micromonosporaceae bacterium]|nr:YbaB/EbfC family nucleoid-associated protein [Micromonosporaceae bacterium]